MSKFLFFILSAWIFVLTSHQIEALQLPPFITKCKYNHPSLEQCIKDNVVTVRPHLKEGIKELGVPPINPFHLDELVLDASKDLVIKMQDIQLIGLDSFNIDDVRVDQANFRGHFNFSFDVIEILGTYDIDGQILILPIKGHGPANITLYKFVIHYEYNYKPIEKNGQEYLHLTNADFQFQAGNIKLKLDNLFNGDKVLGDQLNNFLNENWKEVEALLTPSITDTVMSVIGAIFNKIANNVPLEELFIV